MKVKNLVVHCSATNWGEVLEFDRWHRLKRGWSAIGYHYVILNGRPFRDVNYIEFLDGQVQPGRDLDDDPIFSRDEVGAHVAGRNYESIGICLVGRDEFTHRQLVGAHFVLAALKDRYGLAWDDVMGHYEDENTHKTCPNIPMSAMRDYLKGRLYIDKLLGCIADQAKLGHENLKKKNEAEWYKEWSKENGIGS